MPGGETEKVSLWTVESKQDKDFFFNYEDDGGKKINRFEIPVRQRIVEVEIQNIQQCLSCGGWNIQKLNNSGVQ